MATTVEIGNVRGFVLDDAERGVLDNTNYTLGGLTFVDVSSRVQSLSITRGKNRDLERFSAGTMQVSFANEDRFFDPLVGTAIDVVPRAPVRVTMDGTATFRGSIDDWNFDYETTGRSIASFDATDDFTLLARQSILPSTTPPVETTGARVERVLNMFTVDWPSDRRNIDPGDNTVAAQTFDGENALEYLQLIEASEQGQLFMGKNGDLTFRDANDTAARSDGLVTLSDDDTGIRYTKVTVNYGTELLYNRAVITSPAGTATADDALSQQFYGILTDEVETLNATQLELDDLAAYIVGRYAEPDLRFETVRLNLDRLDTSDRASIIGLEIGDVVRVKFTPNQTGTAIDRYAQIIRIAHSVEPQRHDVVFSFDSLDATPLVLDDLVFGTIDSTNVLGF